MDDISEIYDYILFLRNDCGLGVSLHPMEYDRVICATKLHRFRLHDNPYCLFLGTHPALHQHCVDKQHQVFARCQNGAFCGTCFAGVREYVYPIHCEKEAIGFISVSGYRDEQADAYHNRIALRYGFDPQLLKQSYTALSPLPPRQKTDVLIAPLQRMLELCYLKTARTSHKSDNALCEKVIYFLQLHHTRRVTIEELCGQFYCSRSSISHKFKQYTGQSITSYLNSLRIEDAKSLLTGTGMGIGTISGIVGFENSNYFTNVFTREVGMSPSRYRQRYALPHPPASRKKPTPEAT